LNDIERVLGADAAAYARSKNRGGRNNAQGASYETFYAAFRAIQLMAHALRSSDDGEAIVLEDQQEGFIDDLVIEQPGTFTYSQIKSGAATSWTAGKHAIADDFRMQAVLDGARGIRGDYELVVPDAAVRNALSAARPADVVARVVHFEQPAGVDAMLAAMPQLCQDIDEIAIRPRPSVRSQILLTVLGAWAASPQRITLADFARLAGTGPGPVITVLGPEYVLPEDVVEVLEAIEGLDFGVRRKHLWVRFENRFWGQSDARCGTEEFTKLERFLVDTDVRSGFEVLQALRGDL